MCTDRVPVAPGRHFYTGGARQRPCSVATLGRHGAADSRGGRRRRRASARGQQRKRAITSPFMAPFRARANVTGRPKSHARAAPSEATARICSRDDVGRCCWQLPPTKQNCRRRCALRTIRCRALRGHALSRSYIQAPPKGQPPPERTGRAEAALA